eukprot:scaffold1489_cov194-Cylindrotheca_fusiformis.AAC.16
MMIRSATGIWILIHASNVAAFGTSIHCSRSSHSVFAPAMVSGADIEQEVGNDRQQVVGNTVLYRGKVNEIDYCIAPADVSLSRAYDQTINDNSIPKANTLSLTQVLNNASNRAVRRIILARCWPSEDALNMSFRLAALAEKQAEVERQASGSISKCPVPRPILNLLMRRDASNSGGMPIPRGRTNEQYVADQIQSFRERYGSLPGFNYAEAYLESVLSLATTGDESPRVSEVLESGIYDESYKRVLSVLKSVGVTLENIPGTDRFRIAKDLEDKDICLSMFDKIARKREASATRSTEKSTEPASITNETNNTAEEVENGEKNVNGKKKGFRFWTKDDDSKASEKTKLPENSETILKKDDLGLVLLSDEEPTMTRQLNSLSNIVQRALLFGGDQELLVLSETLETNKGPFVERWYPGTGESASNLLEESRPGVQYLNALILLLRRAYDDGTVTDLDPFVPLIQSYSNAYERMMGTLLELGSGYIRPMPTTDMSMLKPRTAKEELGRFAVWESNFRNQGEKTAFYPEDLEGTWEVKDEVGGELIGISTVVFEPHGEVSVAPPLQGLRWRLDPGPTHLDTCTFQVLGEDGTVLQYRGFVDRGARLEALFSKRSIAIRGSVMFQMRDGDAPGMGDDYWKDMLPINYKTGTTKFVMTKQ